MSIEKPAWDAPVAVGHIDEYDYCDGHMWAHVTFADGLGRPVRVIRSLRRQVRREVAARRSGDRGPRYTIWHTQDGLSVVALHQG
jgi:hypothetical protein